MFKLFKKKQPIFARTPVHGGENELHTLQQELATQRANYKNHNYSGHPEDMLEKIESIENQLQEVLNAQEAGWEPDWDTITEAKARLYWWKDNSAFPIGSPEFENGVNIYTRRLELAQNGFIRSTQ